MTGFDRPNLSYQSIVFAKAKNKQAELIDYLSHAEGGRDRVLLHAQAGGGSDVSAGGRLRGRTVVGYHAGMEQEARDSNQRRFIDRDNAIVVATNAFGMGINNRTCAR